MGQGVEEGVVGGDADAHADAVGVRDAVEEGDATATVGVPSAVAFTVGVTDWEALPVKTVVRVFTAEVDAVPVFPPPAPLKEAVPTPEADTVPDAPPPPLGVTVLDAVEDTVADTVLAATVADTLPVAVMVTVAVPETVPGAPAGPTVRVMDTEGVEDSDARPLPDVEGDAEAVAVMVGVPDVDGDAEAVAQAEKVLPAVAVSGLEGEAKAVKVPCAARASPGPLGLPVAEEVPETSEERLPRAELLSDGEPEGVREPSGERLTVGDAEGLWLRDPEAQEEEEGLTVPVTVREAVGRALADVCTHAVGEGEEEALVDAEREPLGVKVPVTEEVTDHDAEAAADAVMRRVTQSGV